MTSSELVFGYIMVLPGAFSMYRYIALQNDSTGEGPLQNYFLGETMVSLLCLLHDSLFDMNVSFCSIEPEQIFSLRICILLKIEYRIFSSILVVIRFLKFLRSFVGSLCQSAVDHGSCIM